MESYYCLTSNRKENLKEKYSAEVELIRCQILGEEGGVL